MLKDSAVSVAQYKHIYINIYIRKSTFVLDFMELAEPFFMLYRIEAMVLIPNS